MISNKRARHITILLMTWLLQMSNQIILAQSDLNGLLTTLSQICSEEEIPGAMISIVTKDSVLYAGGIGLSQIPDEASVTNKHIFRLGSISKTITALGLVKLVHDGKVSLSTPINAIDPNLDIPNKWSSTHPITIEHILEHTAGFDDMMHTNLYRDSINQIASSLDLVIRHGPSLYARWMPGSRKSYSNPGYVLAGHLIEKITGRPYAEYLKDAILTPLQMHSTNFFPEKPIDSLLVQGYQRLGGNLLEVDYRPTLGGAAGDLCSNAEDMAHFLRFMLGGNESNLLFDPAFFDRIENSNTTIAAKSGYPGDYGLGIYNTWRNGYRWMGHNGGMV